MKKTLLMLMLWPLFALAQNPSELLVRWEGTRIGWSAPTTIPVYYYNTPGGTLTTPTALSSANISGSGISFNSFEQYTGYSSNNWPTANSIDYSKYYQVTLTAGSGKMITLKHFMFNYDGYVSSYRIMYQKSSTGAPSDASFGTNGTLLKTGVNATGSNNTNIACPFSAGVYLNPGETLYVRIYGYNVDQYNNKWFLKQGNQVNQTANPGSVGPALYGVVSNAGGVVAADDSKTTTENQAVNIDVLANDSATNTTFGVVTIDTPSANGTAAVQPNKTITFTPATGFFGTTTFKYKVAGADGSNSIATVTVTVTPFASPTANADTATTGQNIPVTVNVLANDTAGDGTITGVTITGQPANGTAAVSGNNIVYTPAPTFTGTNTIQYKITDSNNKFATGTVTVTVVAVQPAAAVNDVVSTAKNTPITIAVTGNDTMGNSAMTSLVVASNPANGTAVVSGTGIIYTPANNFVGTDSFTYTITNAYNTSSTATVTVDVLQPAPTGALCGTYYIGTGGDFTTITAAVNALNQYGVSCPVTFLLTNTLYKNIGTNNNPNSEAFPITINQFSGSSASNIVTFKPAPNKNVRIEAFRDNATGEYTGVPAVFKLNGADNIIFDGSNVDGGTTRNMFIVNSSFTGPVGGSNDYSDRSVIWVASESASNGANNITVKYAQIKQTYKNTADNYCVGIYSGNNALAGNNELNIGEAYTTNSNLTITGNDFINVKQGVYINGNAAVPTQNVVIHQNDLGAENNTETIIQPAALKNVSGFEFTENLIYKLYRNTAAASLVSSGIYVSGNSSNGFILKNDIKDMTKTLDEGIWFGGIVLETTNANANITVANNFILNVISNNASNYKGNGHGIIVAGGGGYKIYHNTVALNNNQSGSGIGYSAALYVDNGTALDVRNNIFVNNQTTTNTRRTAIAVKAHYSNMNSIFSHLDYNALFSTDAVAFVANNWTVGDIESFQSPDYLASLGAWKTLTGKDANSVNFNPIFASATDLHLAAGNGAIDNDGTHIAAVTKDIDGQVRHNVNPSMGADEYGSVGAPAPGSNEGVYCSSSTTWDGTSWSNGNPSADKDVIFRGNFTQIGGVFYACSVFVEGNAQVNFMSESNAIVTHTVSVATGASLTFESSSNLIQLQNTQNSGNVTVKRQSSKLKRLDYTIWGSPVTGTQTLLQFSPLTMTNRFYYYNVSTNQYMAYTAPQSTTFTKGKGYLIRVPNNHPENVPTVFEGVFNGTPNNGNVYVPLTYLSATQCYNAVGNPYPSPISVTDFIDANIDNIEGTIYVWRKTNDPTKTSYGTITKVGYTRNAAPGGENDLVSDPFAIDPSGVLNTGQGFLVKATGNVNLVFKNNMRKAKNTNKFFRMSGENAADENTGLVASRVWLNVTNSTDAFTQTMIAYTAQGTTAYDNGIDGKALLDGGITLYSVADDTKLAIQARPEFTDTDIVTLGFKTSVAGTFTISIDRVDGVFAGNQAVYVKDNVTGTIHNLKDSSYSFISETGTFDNRFEIMYINSALGTNDPVATPKDVVVYRDGKQVKVQSSQIITGVAVYDIVGKLLYENNTIDATEFTSADINAANQVVIVKVMLDNNQAVAKKIMMN
jgi:hypothetical protein